LAPLLGRLRGRRSVRPDDDVLVLDELLDDGPAMVRQHATTPATPAVVLFTGGTMRSGRPVVLTHGNLVANAFQTRLWVPDMRTGHEVLLGALPLWHAYGLTSVLLTGALAAATIVLVPRPDADELVDTIEQERPTLFPGVPQLYERIARAAAGTRRDLSSLHVCVSGGAPLEPTTTRAFEAVGDGVRLRQGYGQSETSPLAIASPVYGPVIPGTVGLPVTDTVAIVRRLDDPDQRAATGEIGELMVAGPQVMAGYWRGPDEPLEEPGTWLATGDLASVDETGCFTVHGRLGDVVHRGDARIVPAVVEAALRRHPAVVRAALVAVPGPDGSVAAVAVAVPRPGSPVTPDELHGHLASELDPAECPDHIVLRDRLPDSVLGKVLRRVLRDELAAALPDLVAVGEQSEVAP
jgi:long-chain acyl-CoA synthetase